MSAYQSLEARFRRLNLLREAAGVLHWDMSTLMPRGGAEARTEQLAALDLVCHETLSDPAVADLLDEAEAGRTALDSWQHANLREMRRQWRHATALGPDLVEARAKATKRCETIWRRARADADFAAVRPSLEEVLRLERAAALAKAEALGCSPYEALLDQFEPGARVARIEALFAPLGDFLPDFIEAVLHHQGRTAPPAAPQGPFPLAAQERLCRSFMANVGFDFEHGRLDVSTHPFCGGVPEDVRVTTRYDEADFTSALMGVLHETGHALYERGLPARWRLQPVGAARGMVLHESQSLLIEMQACRSPEFLAYAAPLLREAFGGSGPAWAPANLIRLSHRVERGLIRVDADEVTYPAHVILRYRLERAMIADELPVAELPVAWNAGLRELLGIAPPDDRLGCLQDIHWYDGAWGYFPTYTLGAMVAAQIFAAAKAAVPEIPTALGRGDFGPLMGWLRERVHGAGARYDSDELVERATGRPLDPEVFKAHLTARYLA